MASTHPTFAATFTQRAEATPHPLAAKVFRLMESKSSNLALSADVTSAGELLQLADTIGPSIVVFKTHHDLVSDWDFHPQTGTGARLAALAKKHQFVIFEDRKFGDIGNTVQLQYTSGAAHIIEWADIVNVNMIPGKAIVTALADAAAEWRRSKGEGEEYLRGLLILAQMSSAGNLMTPDYTQACVEAAREHPEFVIGYVSQQSLNRDASDTFLHMAPGCQLPPPGQDTPAGDGKGQQYNTPEKLVNLGIDVVIVGRGILKASDPAAEAERYREAAWDAYKKRTGKQE